MTWRNQLKDHTEGNQSCCASVAPHGTTKGLDEKGLKASVMRDQHSPVAFGQNLQRRIDCHSLIADL